MCFRMRWTVLMPMKSPDFAGGTARISTIGKTSGELERYNPWEARTVEFNRYVSMLGNLYG